MHVCLVVEGSIARSVGVFGSRGFSVSVCLVVERFTAGFNGSVCLVGEFNSIGPMAFSRGRESRYNQFVGVLYVSWFYSPLSGLVCGIGPGAPSVHVLRQ